ncbi:hypothetical protein GCM10023149_28920 [Mucilaginibacter gynuensis]|uniref:Signal transduction histidine kinase internal region domain-containing protein n=2 Tax=Mucilaginibacter gynuensis TaxID=1302236 RepID=A0ABP8GKV4_9SPHI
MNRNAVIKKAEQLERLRLETQNRQMELQNRLAVAENAYLQQQISPHMLFNALSFIHSSVYKVSEQAGNCALLLADILRFSLDSNNDDGKIFVEDELEQIENLVEINRYRFQQQFISCNFHGDFTGLRLIPLVLLTLTENVFKHGNLQDSEQPARIWIGFSEGVLTYYAKNLKKQKSNEPPRKQIGLSNIRIRLDHTYPGNYKLKVDESETHFITRLSINL